MRRFFYLFLLNERFVLFECDIEWFYFIVWFLLTLSRDGCDHACIFSWQAGLSAIYLVMRRVKPPPTRGSHGRNIY